MMQNDKKTKIACPNCYKADTWHADNPFKPFCSERCKLIDLGAWASEKHLIPGEPAEPKPTDEPEEDSQ